jgi:2-succinyl-6-hydroxy-2,4-cyclohexadiene-1-carboxylate synthase
MPIANINGIDLNYEITGQGNAIVCIHGYTGSSQDWGNQIPVLSPKYTVVALDLRGHGKSAAPSGKEDYSIKIFAEDVFGLLKILNIKRCCLIGHSLGGFTALEFAIKHPDMLSALVLVSTSSGKLVRHPGFAELRQKLDKLARSQDLETAFEYDAANNPQRIETFQKHPEQREMARERVLATSVDGYIYAWRAISEWEPVTSRISEIKVPALIYLGEEDLLFAEAAQVMKEGIAGSELVTVKGVGHSPHWESPNLFNEILLEFLGRINW